VSATGAGIQEYEELLDPGLRRGDGLAEFYTNASRIIVVQKIGMLVGG
jgi:hypothetical protein